MPFKGPQYFAVRQVLSDAINRVDVTKKQSAATPGRRPSRSSRPSADLHSRARPSWAGPWRPAHEPPRKETTTLTWRHRLSRWDVKSAPYLYIAPFFLLFALVGLFPLLYTGWVALNKWSLVTGNQGFLGLDNFSYVLAQPRFWDAVVNTFSIFLLSSVPQILLAIAIAACWTRTCGRRRSGGWASWCPTWSLRSPSPSIFGQLFADQSGVINAVLTGIGLDPIGWHSERLWSPRRHRDHGQLPLDRLQHLDLPRRDAGRAPRRHRGRRGRRRHPCGRPSST